MWQKLFKAYAKPFPLSKIIVELLLPFINYIFVIVWGKIFYCMNDDDDDYDEMVVQEMQDIADTQPAFIAMLLYANCSVIACNRSP